MGSAVRSVTRLVTRPLQSIGILPKAPSMPAPPEAPTAPDPSAAMQDAAGMVKKQYAVKKGRRSTIMTSPQGLESEEQIARKKLLGTER